MNFPNFPLLSLFFPIERAPVPSPKLVEKNTVKKAVYFLNKLIYDMTQVFPQNYEV